MSFEDELRINIAQKEQRNVNLHNSRVASEKKRLEESKGKVQVALQMSLEYVAPYLESVNKVLAKSKGEISLPHMIESVPDFSTSLTWDYRKDKQGATEEKRISFQINPDNKTVSYVTEKSSRCVTIRVDEKDYEERIKKLLLDITSDPENYTLINNPWSGFQA